MMVFRMLCVNNTSVYYYLYIYTINKSYINVIYVLMCVRCGKGSPWLRKLLHFFITIFLLFLLFFILFFVHYFVDDRMAAWLATVDGNGRQREARENRPNARCSICSNNGIICLIRESAIHSIWDKVVFFFDWRWVRRWNISYFCIIFFILGIYRCCGIFNRLLFYYRFKQDFFFLVKYWFLSHFKIHHFCIFSQYN